MARVALQKALDVHVQVRYNVLEGNAMEHMNATNARKNFFNLISDVNRDHVPVRISGPRAARC